MSAKAQFYDAFGVAGVDPTHTREQVFQQLLGAAQALPDMARLLGLAAGFMHVGPGEAKIEKKGPKV